MIKLAATNYTLCRPRMEDLLSYRDLYDPIEDNGTNPDPSKETSRMK